MIKKRARKNWLIALLAAVMVLFMLPTMAFALRDNEHTFLVSTADEFLAAIAAVNRSSGDYEISLQSDIDISRNNLTDFISNTVTIIGNGHTLSTWHGLGCIGRATTVNLGKPDGTDTLILKQYEFYNCIAYADEGGRLNVYDGVTLRDARMNGSAGGIQLNGSAVCHMYGGTIINCKDAFNTCAGGVMVDEGSTFFMHGGIITDCQGGVSAQGYSSVSRFYMQGGEIKNCTSGHEGYYGAGVLIYPGAIFEMTGGKISGCTSDNYGAGVIMLSSGNTLTGGEISGNSAAYGGGIFLQGSAVISDGIKIYDNTATICGDDIYFNASDDGSSSLTLGNTPSGLILTATGQAIDGWYLDLPRWTADGAQKYSPVNPITAEIYLKAAHGANLHPIGPADIPQTGDNSNIALWAVMLLASGTGLAGAITYNRKKDSAK